MHTAHRRLTYICRKIEQVEGKLYGGGDFAKRTLAQEECMMSYLLQARGCLKLAMSHWLETKPPKKT